MVIEDLLKPISTLDMLSTNSYQILIFNRVWISIDTYYRNNEPYVVFAYRKGDKEGWDLSDIIIHIPAKDIEKYKYR